MTAREKGQEQVFPLTYTTGSFALGFTVTARKGMTKREIIAKDVFSVVIRNINWNDPVCLQSAAAFAVRSADALLDALND